MCFEYFHADYKSVKYSPERTQIYFWNYRLNDNIWHRTNYNKFHFAPRTDSDWNGLNFSWF